ncbi:hypothetical protein [Croceitalea dokdonensis]|uniref:DoxX family protein n=1 Tax=Croceitalea dokdonensis TaxID=346188 RepID=UPI0006CA561B|nr:hypothetical protein [Croceitalea dokdonensis]
METVTLKKYLRAILAGFMVIAGVNHFLQPEFYIPLIPDYLPFPGAINSVSGSLEFLFGCLLIWERYRLFAAYGLIALLLLFIPSHTYFISLGSCIPQGLCTAAWVSWTRLILVHPLLLFWVWYVRE